MGRVVLRKDLETMVAARLVRPKVERILDQMRGEAARRAPDAKTWITAEDERVRYSHEHTHGQTVPANLRYQLPKMTYVSHLGYLPVPGRYDLAREPRDPDLPDHQTENCRCESLPVPEIMGASIRASAVTVAGPRVTGEIYTRFPRAAESEFGTADDEAAYFMRGALVVAQAAFRRRR